MDEPRADTDAEQYVLGAVLTSGGRALADVPNLAAADFHRPTHEALWQLLEVEAAAGRPCEPVAIAEVLRRRPIRGVEPLYLHDLMNACVTPANVDYYAARVAAAARLRRLQAIAARLGELAGSAAIDDVDAVVEQARAELDGAVAATGGGDALVAFPEALQAAMDTWEEPLDDVLPTRWVDLDRDFLNGGLRAGHLVIIGARPAVGKALALDTPVPTPTGWTTMGAIQAGQQVLGADGKPVTVTHAWDVRYGRPCYEVEFSDGSVIVADAEHQWLTDTRASRRAATPPRGYVFNRTSPFSRDQRHLSQTTGVVTTEEIAATLYADADGRANHSVRLAAPLALPGADLPIHPYVLGAWLGDGASYHNGFTTADGEMVENLRACGVDVVKHAAQYGYGLRGLHRPLRLAGLLQNKHIPTAYLRASEEQRRDLLAGLLDTDGTVGHAGGVQLALTNRRLAEDALELVLTLGYRATMTTKAVKGRHPETSTCYMVNFTTADKVFRLTRKADRLTTRVASSRERRYITDVRPVPSVPVRCIAVDNDDHLYLAGRTMIPTHNSVAAAVIAAQVASYGGGVLWASLEMGRSECVNRVAANMAGVQLDYIEGHRLTQDHWTRVMKFKARAAEWRLFIDDRPNIGITHIRKRARDVARTPGGLKLIVVDYLQLMAAADTKAPRHEQVAALSRGLKLLAREFGVPVIALAQVNRASTSRQDKRPTMSDLRESGQIEADADEIILLHRDDEEAPGEIEFIVEKNRHGRTGRVALAWAPHYSRIASMGQDL